MISRALVMTAALFVTTVAADAAVIVQTYNANQTTPSFAMQQFNPSKGTLQSVEISFSPSVFRTVGLNSNDWMRNIQWEYTIRLTSIDAGAPVLPSWTGTVVHVTDAVSDSYDFSAVGPTQTQLIETGLNIFTGLGAFTYTVSGSGDLQNAGGATIYQNQTHKNEPSASLKVTYTYEAFPAVPEPGNWAMMISGFGLTGAMMRRRRMLAAA